MKKTLPAISGKGFAFKDFAMILMLADGYYRQPDRKRDRQHC